MISWMQDFYFRLIQYQRYINKSNRQLRLQGARIKRMQLQHNRGGRRNRRRDRMPLEVTTPITPAHKKLIQPYKMILKRSKLVYNKNQGGLCAIIYPFEEPSYFKLIVPNQMFFDIYVDNFKDRAYPQLDKSTIINVIITLLTQAIQFAVRNHFNVNQSGTIHLKTHCSDLQKKDGRNFQDHRISIPGANGLLKMVFKKIFRQHLRNDSRFREILKRVQNRHPNTRKQHFDYLWETVQNHLQKIKEYDFDRKDRPQRRRQKHHQRLLSMDRHRVDSNLIQWTLLQFKQNTYTYQKYECQRSLDPHQRQVIERQKNFLKFMLETNRKNTRTRKRQQQKRKKKNQSIGPLDNYEQTWDNTQNYLGQKQKQKVDKQQDVQDSPNLQNSQNANNLEKTKKFVNISNQKNYILIHWNENQLRQIKYASLIEFGKQSRQQKAEQCDRKNQNQAFWDFLQNGQQIPLKHNYSITSVEKYGPMIEFGKQSRQQKAEQCDKKNQNQAFCDFLQNGQQIPLKHNYSMTSVDHDNQQLFQNIKQETGSKFKSLEQINRSQSCSDSFDNFLVIQKMKKSKKCQ